MFAIYPMQLSRTFPRGIAHAARIPIFDRMSEKAFDELMTKSMEQCLRPDARLHRRVDPTQWGAFVSLFFSRKRFPLRLV